MKKIPDKLGPLVSVIMNCYNGEKYLRESICSVINQTYKNWEIIFWDNQSTDRSRKILKSFKDKRIKYFRSKNFSKLYTARNLAISKAKGKFISFLDVDDYWINTKLEKQISLFKKEKNLIVVYSNVFILNNSNKSYKLFSKDMLPSGKITQNLLSNYRMPVITTILKKSIFDKIKFKNNYEIIGDFDFFTKLSLKGQFGPIQEPLAYYRIHEKNISRTKIDLFIKEFNFWIKDNKNLKPFKNYNLQGVFSQMQILKIKKYLLNNSKIKMLEEIFKRPINLKKLKFLAALIFPKAILNKFFYF